jgi:hypothetical protein
MSVSLTPRELITQPYKLGNPFINRFHVQHLRFPEQKQVLLLYGNKETPPHMEDSCEYIE